MARRWQRLQVKLRTCAAILFAASNRAPHQAPSPALFKRWVMKGRPLWPSSRIRSLRCCFWRFLSDLSPSLLSFLENL